MPISARKFWRMVMRRINLSIHYPMNTPADVRNSSRQIERDYRSGILDDFQYADMRALLRDTMARMELAPKFDKS